MLFACFDQLLSAILPSTFIDTMHAIAVPVWGLCSSSLLHVGVILVLVAVSTSCLVLVTVVWLSCRAASWPLWHAGSDKLILSVPQAMLVSTASCASGTAAQTVTAPWR